jgi:hypothetical protein
MLRLVPVECGVAADFTQTAGLVHDALNIAFPLARNREKGYELMARSVE